MKPAIIDIRGIGPAAVAALKEHGIGSIEKLAGMSTSDLATVPGFSAARAASVIAAAAALLPSGKMKKGTAEKTKAGAGGKRGKKDKKGKQDKKDKKGRKNRKRDKKKNK